MEVIKYQGRNVYTSSNSETTQRDLASSEARTVVVEDAYFFELDGERMPRKIDFDRDKIDKLNSGLNVEVKEGSEIGAVSIVGLERIVSFMCDLGCIGKDLSTLKG